LEGTQAAYPNKADLRFVPSRRSWTPYTPRHQIETAEYWRFGLNVDREDEFLVSRIANLTIEEKAEFNKLLKELLLQKDQQHVVLLHSFHTE
jgi:hypothetical protein